MARKRPTSSTAASSPKSSDFMTYLTSFHDFVSAATDSAARVTTGVEDRRQVQALATAATAITADLARDLGELYGLGSPDEQALLDRATVAVGANSLVTESMTALRAETGTEERRTRSAFSTLEALKKILKEILDIGITKLLPVGKLGKLIKDGLARLGGIGAFLRKALTSLVDIEGILRVLDNILKKIGQLFSGDDLATEMQEDELANLRVSQELTKLRGLRLATLAGLPTVRDDEVD